MNWAIYNGERKEAEPGLKAECPLCGYEVVAKCGDINIWHWAHAPGVSECDDWRHPHGKWHTSWKYYWPKQFHEVIIEKQGRRHVADVKTQDDTVIEVQHSPIAGKEIRKREDFYGEKMGWVFDATGPYLSENLIIWEAGDGFHNFTWWNPRRSIHFCRRHVFLDLGFGNVLMFFTGFPSLEKHEINGKDIPIVRWDGQGKLMTHHALVRRINEKDICWDMVCSKKPATTDEIKAARTFQL